MKKLSNKVLKLSRKALNFIIIAIGVIAVTVTVIVYSVFASNHIFNESKEHLGEIYEQVNSFFQEKITGYRSVLHAMANRIEITGNNSDGDIRRFIGDQEKLWNFTNFYFIGNERVDDSDNLGYTHIDECKPVVFSGENSEAADHEPVELRFRRSLKELIIEDRGGVVGMPCGDNDLEQADFVMLAISVTPNTYDGFEYNAIGFSFASDDMKNLLAVSTFGKDGQCYVVLPDGNIIINSLTKTYTFTNILDFLENECTVSRSSIAEIKSDWINQKKNACLVTAADGEYYLTYTPIGFDEWMLVGAVKSSRVNSSLSRFRTITIVVMVAIFVCVIAVMTWILIMQSRRRIRANALVVKTREKMLNLFAANSNDLFFMFSPVTFESEYVSANVSDVLGIDIEKVKNDVRSVLDAATQEHKTFDSQSLLALPYGGVWESDIEMQNVKTGTPYWYRISLYHSVADGRHYCVLMFSDRTADKNMREKLEEALEIAKNANSAKSNFLSNMSHDIRTPMNAIIGYSTLLAKDAANPERVREFTHKITYSGQHLLSLINDILDMSKIESGKTSLNIEQFALPEFIEELYSIMEPQASAKKLKFDVHTKGVIPEYVLGDKLRLNQVILNILSNAVKYTEHGGAVELRVEAMKQNVHHHSHLKFTVADTGIGMSPEFVKTIFEPFSREETVQTKNIQGTGLGMAITKNIVDLMGGIISVESTPGEGSVFAVELELAVVEGTPDDEDFWQKHNVTRVLVVDDEEDICMDIKELMADTGVDIKYALSGEQAIEAVDKSITDEEEFNIVLLDWKMPGMDGVETARRIREIAGRDLPIMVLTSYSFEDIEDEAREAGIDLFLSKPFFVTNFRKAIMKINSDGSAAEIEPAPDAISLEGLKILAAEDNAINAEILIELLDIEGVTCDIAVNGQDAVEKFEASEPGQYDMIFMDIQMPIMNGYDATRAIRKSKHQSAKKIPIIAMTANAFDTDVKAALDAGMNAHLAKPIDMDKLKQTITKIRNEQKKRSGKRGKKD